MWFSIQPHFLKNYLLELCCTDKRPHPSLGFNLDPNNNSTQITGHGLNWAARVSLNEHALFTCTGRAKKSNPLGKICYLWNCSKFFRQIYKLYRGGFRQHILQISWKYLVAFKNYNYLNLNVHFSK